MNEKRRKTGKTFSHCGDLDSGVVVVIEVQLGWWHCECVCQDSVMEGAASQVLLWYGAFESAIGKWMGKRFGRTPWREDCLPNNHHPPSSWRKVALSGMRRGCGKALGKQKHAELDVHKQLVGMFSGFRRYVGIGVDVVSGVSWWGLFTSSHIHSYHTFSWAFSSKSSWIIWIGLCTVLWTKKLASTSFHNSKQFVQKSTPLILVSIKFMDLFNLKSSTKQLITNPLYITERSTTSKLVPHFPVPQITPQVAKPPTWFCFPTIDHERARPFGWHSNLEHKSEPQLITKPKPISVPNYIITQFVAFPPFSKPLNFP